MKTFSNYLALVILLIIANISIAGDINPDTNSTSFEKNKAFSIFQMNYDNDKIKSEKKPYSDNKSKAISISAPVASEDAMSYLKFDVNNFISEEESEITELPVSEFNYLRFDVNDYVEPAQENIGELPESDLSKLRFDVNSFIKAALENDANDIGELPLTE